MAGQLDERTSDHIDPYVAQTDKNNLKSINLQTVQHFSLCILAIATSLASGSTQSLCLMQQTACLQYVPFKCSAILVCVCARARVCVLDDHLCCMVIVVLSFKKHTSHDLLVIFLHLNLCKPVL